MALLIQTGFEDYTDGRDSLIANGWETGINPDPPVSNGAPESQVVSTISRTGVKSVLIGHDLLAMPDPADGWGFPGSLVRTIANATQTSVIIDLWTYTPHDEEQEFYPSGPTLEVYYEPPATTPDSGLCGMTYFGQSGIRIINPEATLFTIDPDAGPLVHNVWQHLRLEMRFSSVLLDGTDINSNGCIRFYVDEVLVYNGTGLRVFTSTLDWPSGGNSYRKLYLGSGGYFDDLDVRDDDVSCLSQPASVSTVFGINTTIAGAMRAVAFGLDGATNVFTESGKAKVFGNFDVKGYVELEPMTAPDAGTMARLYIDVADGDLKVIFPNGQVRTIDVN